MKFQIFACGELVTQGLSLSPSVDYLRVISYVDNVDDLAAFATEFIAEFVCILL